MWRTKNYRQIDNSCISIDVVINYDCVIKAMKNQKIVTGIFLTMVLLLGCRTKQPFFETVSSSKTNIDFRNDLDKKPLFSILYYLYYYNGGGVATGDINNDGLADIYFTANTVGHNKLYLNKGNFEFEDITEKAGVQGLSDWCSGVTMADINGDGLLDIYVSTVSGKYNLEGHNELYINNGNSTFSEKSEAFNLNTKCFTTQSAFFDYDHDGDLDCFILNQSHHPHANIVDTSARLQYDASSGDRVYRNDLKTSGRFTDVSKEAGIYQSNLGYGLGISVADFNNDGWEDLYIGNDFHENDYYYINQKNGKFKEEGSKHFDHYSRFSMGNDAADYNNDGQLDVVTVDMLPPDEKTLKTYGSDENPDIYRMKLTSNGYQYQCSRNCLQRNNGNGTSYSDEGLIAGISATDWSWCPLFADFDNDGNKDLFISSGIVKRPVDLDYIKFVSDLKLKGMDRTDAYDDEAIKAMPDGASHPYFYKGNGNAVFNDLSSDWGTGQMKGYYNGAAYADLDNDGNLDMVINSLNAKAIILRNNNPQKKHWLTLAFAGDTMNSFGIGAKAYLYTKKGLQYQQLMLTRGFQSSCEPRLHFGLDSLQMADSLLVVWPDQRYQVLKNISADKQLQLKQSDARDSFMYAVHFPPEPKILHDITDQITINWQHRENEFSDYNTQYLIPHKISTRGPKVAVGDVNKDGLDDFYACGAKGQPGILMVQQSNGSFVSQDTALFKKYAVCEDVDAVFFDANNDGNTDLWVVTGGNEMPSSEIANTDRLYMNDGKGHFTISEKAFTQQHLNKSCIAVADIDKDGDNDVFIGHMSDPERYGMPLSSYLYINDGKGKFTIASIKLMNLLRIGMVTSASFADLNKDGWPDLVLAGEWMPLKVYINDKGTFHEADIAGSSGLWQNIYTTDVNGDGYTDILAGNWGHNTKLWAGKNGPLKLYVNDFDHNGFIEQVMCYTVDGKEYTFLAKDELERALPVLKKAYVTYGEVAGKTVQYTFFDLFRNYTELKAEVLSSSYFINDGKGNFKRYDLPLNLQLAPLFSFQNISSGTGENLFAAGGNFYDVPPYEGRYDALSMGLFSTTGSAVKYVHQPDLLSLGQVRDLKRLHSAAHGDIIIAARNNAPLMFFQFQ
jgi:hypothetical protein